MALLRRPIVVAGVLLAFSISCAFILLSRPQAARSATSAPITGYLWSDTIGWISMQGTSPAYGITVASDGSLSGYAWSDNVGWISANAADLSGCPTAPCTAQISGTSLTGWLKVLAGGAGGWDGWISLSGTSPAYGVSENTSTGAFSGYAWGDVNLGWIDWQYASTTFNTVPPCQSTQGNYCADSSGTPNATGPQIWNRNPDCTTAYVSTCSYQCSSGACVAPPSPQGNIPGQNSSVAIMASPSIVPSGKTTTVTWNVVNVTSCTVTSTGGDSWSGLSGTQTSKPISNQTVFKLSCTDLGGNPWSQSITVNVIPVFREL